MKKIHTTIEGEKVTLIGKLSKCKTFITIKGTSMICTIQAGDTIEDIEVKKRQPRQNNIPVCPFDMANWFRVGSSQLQNHLSK